MVVPTGREISAPHAAKRNVELKEQLPISAERTTEYYMLHFVSSFQDALSDITINPTFRFAACGAEILCPFRAFAPHQAVRKRYGKLRRNDRGTGFADWGAR
ncbi:hypothetical protein Barb4_03418 [Bacteroidales bacterium Barb4]|nr:hypothetical protein Barb4_03418 [Bacteroidales bacterium Barb4]